MTDSPFEELTPEQTREYDDASLKEEVAKAARRIKIQDEARRRVSLERMAALWEPPASENLKVQLTAERHSLAYLVDGLMGGQHNVVLAGQYKTGKTTLGGNLLRSLVDNVPFLGRDTHLPDDVRVTWWNGEMERDDWLDRVVRPLRIKHKDDIEPMHLRGRRMPLLDDYVAEWVTKWLRNHDIGVWIVDSWRRLCVWSGVNENLNEQIELLTDRIDQIKSESGCSAFLAIAHTGRLKSDPGEERVRGGTAVDDWVDGRWLMVRKHQPADMRFFFAEGRGIGMKEIAVQLDEDTNRITLGVGNRSNAVDPQLVDSAVKVVERNPGMFTSVVQKTLGIRTKNSKVADVLFAADRQGRVYHVHRLGGKGYQWWPGKADKPCDYNDCPSSNP